MRKFIAIIAVLFITASSFAQSAFPRTGVSAGTDNTYRVLTYNYSSPSTDKAGLDTIAFAPYSFHTDVFVDSVLDSVAVKIASTTNSYFGDEFVVIVHNSLSTGKCIRWAGAYFATATTTTGSQNGTLYLSNGKEAVIRFVFNGSKWVEVSRMAQ